MNGRGMVPRVRAGRRVFPLVNSAFDGRLIRDRRYSALLRPQLYEPDRSSGSRTHRRVGMKSCRIRSRAAWMHFAMPAPPLTTGAMVRFGSKSSPPVTSWQRPWCRRQPPGQPVSSNPVARARAPGGARGLFVSYSNQPSPCACSFQRGSLVADVQIRPSTRLRAA